ncbi:MAG: ribose-phosphate diphosphokinase [Candidatus Parcubacteria bacterium]|nr:ribose-phosphate diphosphokinase [Candidatus Parcubacteria bacterium]
MKFRGVKVFALPGSDILAEKVCFHLDQTLPIAFKPEGGLTLTRPDIFSFDNENVMAQIDNVRGYFVVVIHTQCPPLHDRLFSLFALLDAIQNSNAADLLLAFPYMPYARSDRKDKPRISVMSKVMAEFLNNVLGVRRVMLLDPHDSHVKHYFKPSADEISSIYLYADFIKSLIATQLAGDTERIMLAFSDASAAKRFSKLTELLPDLKHDYIDKYRKDHKGTLELQKEILCKGKIIIMVDDEVCSGNTAIQDAESLKTNGAEKIIMIAPHAPLAKIGLTSEQIMIRIKDSPIDQIIITDTIPAEEKLKFSNKFQVISVAKLMALAIQQTILDESVTKLHDFSYAEQCKTGNYPVIKLD